MWTSSNHRDPAEPPSPEQLERWQRRISPPENEFPASLGITVLLASTDDVAVGLNQVDAFSTGFRFNLAVRMRQLPPGLVQGDLFMHIAAHVPDLVIPIENRLLVGIEYSDGHRASTLGEIWAYDPDTEIHSDKVVLVPQGGGGSELAVDQGFWVSPLPPPGPVTIVVAWPGFGIPETLTALDGGNIRAAAAESRTLWQPKSTAQPPQPTPPPRPTSGWFAEPHD